MADAATCSLLITTRDRKDDLLRTIEVMMGSLPPDCETIVFDDGSEDGTAAAVAGKFPRIRLIRQYPSVGYIAARNRLLGMAGGVYSVTLDDDAEIVTGDFDGAIREYFDHHPRCAVLALPAYWGDRLPLGCSPKDEKIRQVRSFVGCGHVWRMEAWKSIPQYPEWFGMYGEEDFAALNLLKQGWEVHYFPRALVHHRVDLKSRRKSGRFWRYRRHFRAGIFLMLLFYPWAALPRRLGSAFWGQIRNHLVRQRDWIVVPMLASVLLDLFRNLWRIMRFRSPLQKAQWEQWTSLGPAVIYWQPESCEEEEEANAVHGG